MISLLAFVIGIYYSVSLFAFAVGFIGRYCYLRLLLDWLVVLA